MSVLPRRLPALSEAHAPSEGNNVWLNSPQNVLDIFNAQVQSLLLRGGYLNDIDLYDAMSRHVPEPQRLREFQNISTLNRVIGNAVSCFWHGRSVRIFRELEKFVTERVAIYRHIDTIPPRFEELGMGCLLQNSLVKRHFQFSDSVQAADLLDLSTADIITSMYEFRNATKINFTDSTLEAKFLAFLRVRYGRAPVGVDLDFKPLFASVCRSDSDWQGKLSAAKKECSDTYKHILSQAVRTLQQDHGSLTKMSPQIPHAPSSDPPATPDSRFTVRERIAEPYLQSIGICVTDLRHKLQAMSAHNALWNPNVYFLGVVDSVWHNTNMRNPCMGLRVMATLGTDGWTSLSNVQSCYHGDASISEVLLVSGIPKGGRHLITSCVLGLMVYLLSHAGPAAHPGGSTTSAVDLTEEVNLTQEEDSDGMNVVADAPHRHAVCDVRQYLNAHLVADVPQACMDLVARLLQRLVDSADFFEFDINLRNRTSGKGKLNWSLMQRRLETILDGHAPVVPHVEGPHAEESFSSLSLRQIVLASGRCALARDDYVAIVTMCVIYHRILHAAEMNPSLVATAVSPLQPGAQRDADGRNAPCSAEFSSIFTHPRDVVIELFTDFIRALIADEKKLLEYVKLSQSTNPACAIMSVFSTIERAVNDHFRVPAFECVRLGGSFVHFMSQLLQSNQSNRSESENVLCAAVCTLYEGFVPTGQCSAGSYVGAAEDASTQPATSCCESTEPEVASTEALLAAVSTHLSAVLSSREFEQDSSTEDNIFFIAANSVANQVTQLLGEVEQRVQETEGFWTAASTGTSASFLSIASALIEGDAEVAQRVQRLLVLPQQSEEERLQLGSGMTGEGRLQAQILMSMELAVQAVLQNAASGAGSSIFGSIQHCKEHIAQVLVAAFRVPLEAALPQANRVFQQLKAQGAIHFDESRGSVEIRTAQASAVGAVLTFATPTGVDVDLNSSADALSSSAWTENMIELLLQTPLGTSCSEFTLWQVQHGPEAPSIADFILQHHAVLQSRRQSAEVVTFFVIPGADDCVPLPQGIPTAQVSDRLLQALHAKQYWMAAAFCMAASMALIDATAVSSAVNAFFLQSYESFGADAMDRLSDLSLHLASALPRSCRSGHCSVLRLCVKALAAAGKINLDTAQHCVWQAALRTGSVGLHLVRLLVSVGMMAPADFSVFAQCAREWSVNSASIIPRALAESEKRDQEAQNAEQITLMIKATLPDAPVTAANVSIGNESNEEIETCHSDDGEEILQCERVNEQKAFILDLLQRQYHYTQGGLVRPAAETPEGRQLQQAMMLLSATLYSSQVHFVMELIQNADDNTYLPGVTPTIRLELFPHAVIVYNNEQGFSDNDIEAVCNVGGSTKANKTGYIGQKGIGFKSVFSISDVPEVHSNGYHIAFRREVSMLEPQWLDPTSESQWPAQYDSSGTYYETCLRLRLDVAALKNLAKLNQDIQAVFNGKLILFLNKLERMVLEDRMRNQVVEHCRTRLSENWMRISIEASTASSPFSSATSSSAESSLSEVFWLVLRHRFSPTVRRVEVVVAETEVAIAFKFIKTSLRFKSTKKQQPKESAADTALVRALAEEADLYNEVPTKKHHTGGDQTRELGVAAEEDEQIRLDFSEGLMPVYAYLPTSTCCFRFMVQGDFVLPTNRESILEQNEWNLGLLNPVPKVFVQAITEMSRWCEAEAQSQAMNKMMPSPTDFPVLSQLSGSAYRLLIEPADLLRALPRRREATRDYIEGVVSSIYQELRSVPCLQGRSGAMCAPSQLVAVHHLDFDPATFVSEELLLAATGCQYAMHDTGAYELDNDLVADLGVRIFDISCVVECLPHLTERAGEPKRVAEIAHALLGLEAVTRHHSSRKHSRGASTLSKTLEPAVRDVLRQLCIWPTSTGNYVTLEHTLLFVQKRHRGAAFSPQQQECLNEFANRLHMIDGALLDAAAACTAQGADLLCNFLVDNFKQVRLTGVRTSTNSSGKAGLGTELGALFSGGVEELTPDIVLKRVILPAYKRFAEQQSAALSVPANGQDSSKTAEVVETEPSLDRRTAAAFLAFFYHSNWGSRVNLNSNSDYARFVQTIGVVVPTLTATETADELLWGKPSLVLVKSIDPAVVSSAPQTEVHLGLELTESPSSVLAALRTTTALRQLFWQVLDPLAACFMLGSGKVSLDQQKEVYTAAEVNAAFRGAQESIIKNWKDFLLRVGLVNFFGVYETAPLMYEAPQLIRLLDAVLDDSVAVRTSFAPSDEIQSVDEDDECLALFLPNPDNEDDKVAPSVLRVTPDVHASLLKIAELISLEVLQLRQTKAASSVEQGSAFLADLDRRCWLPIAVHEKLLSGSSTATTLHYVCAPRYVISTHAEKSSSIVWYFGAHCAYLPYQLARNPGFRALFHFHEISSKESPSAEFLMGYLAWLCKQAEATIFNSVKFMRWFYQQVQSSLLSSEDSHASSLVQQQLTSLLQSDAALVWIPDQVQFSPPTVASNAGVVDPYINESFDACYAGKMFPLSRLVKRDPSEHLHFGASPVKSLALFYADSAVMQLFARTQYCKTCQAVEGMFGVRGGGHHTLSYPQLRCTCVHSKDNRMSALISDGGGFVRDTPCAVDLAEVLQQHCGDAERGSNDAVQLTDAVLTTISVNIWKCCHITNGLRPYSCHQLRELLQYFNQHALLPLHSTNLRFVNANPRGENKQTRLALDDLEAFKLFEPELMALQGSVEWLQVFSADTPEVDNVFEEDGGSSAYSMDALDESEQHLLQLPAADFRATVGTIPRQTFLAPSNKLALYEFLGIKKFSDHIQESWIKEPSAKQTKTGPAATLVGILNNLLAYAQAHYHHREQKKQHSPQLSQFDALQVFNMVAQLGSAGTRVHSLMQMEVVECHVLQRRVTLALGEVRAENVLDAAHYREFITSPTGTRSSTLYVSAQLSAAEVQSLAVSLLTKALRVEVALLEQRQDASRLKELERKVHMVANRATNAEILQTILDANDFGPLPPDLAPWKMEVVQYSELSDAPKSPWEMLAELSEEQRAANQPNLDAYEKMQHSSSAHRVNVAAQRRFLDTTNPVASAPPTRIVPAAQNCGSDTSAPLPTFRPPLPPGPPPPPPPPLLVTPHAPRTLPQQEEVCDYSPGDARQRNAFSSTATAESGGPMVTPFSAQSERSHALGAKTAQKTCTGKKRAWDDDASPSPAVPVAGPASLSGTYVLTTPSTSSQSASGKKQRSSNNNIPVSNPQVDIVFCEPDEGAQFKVTVPASEALGTAVDASLADEIYSDLVRKGGATGVEAQSVAISHAFVSGRLGEEVAVRHLRRRFLQQQQPTSGSCTAVKWLNEHTESGLPYDIELTYADGSVKYCEVKTRSVANYSTPNTPQSSAQQLQAPSQWLVSPAEVARAHQERQGYFCVFVSLRIDYATRQLEELQTRIVGYEHGFMNAIRNKDAKLWVEVSDEHGIYS